MWQHFCELKYKPCKAIKTQNGYAIFIGSDLILKRCMFPYALANDSEIEIPPRQNYADYISPQILYKSAQPL